MPPSPHAPSLPIEPIAEAVETTWVENVVLLATVVLMPLLDRFESQLGVSQSMLLLIGLFTYVAVRRPFDLLAVASQRIFLALGVLLTVGLISEELREEHGITDIVRIGMMGAAALPVAALCRDRRSLRTVFWGYGIVGFYLSFYLLLNLHSVLNEIEDETFRQVERTRLKLVTNEDMGFNLNRLSFFCSQGCMGLLSVGLDRGMRRSRLLQFPLFVFGGACTWPRL